MVARCRTEKENKVFCYGKNKDNLVVDVVRDLEFFNIWMSIPEDTAPLQNSTV